MSSLKLKEVHYYEVDYYDWDTFVYEETGHEHSIVACLEQGNDSQVRLEPLNSRFDMDSRQTIHGELDQYDQATLDQFLNHGEAGVDSHYALPALLLGHFVRQGKIPDGTYLVEISW